MTARDRLDEWAALADAATEGPWFTVGPDDEYVRPGDVVGPGEPGERYIICEHAGQDAAFIAAARTGWPAAVAALHAVLDGRPNHAETCRCGACSQHKRTVRAITEQLGGGAR